MPKKTKIKTDAIPMKKKRVEKARSAYFLNEALFIISPPNNQKIRFFKKYCLSKICFLFTDLCFEKEAFRKRQENKKMTVVINKSPAIIFLNIL